MHEHLQAVYDAIVIGNRALVQTKIQEALDAGLDPTTILNDAMIAAMSEVGRRFECHEYYVPEMLVSAKAMQAGLAILKPHLPRADAQNAGKVVAGTVRGDLHDIGKNLVCILLEGAGFQVIDLGTDVPPQKFCDAVREHAPNFLCMSSLLTTTMVHMKKTIDALKEAGLRDKVKVLIGGAPVTEEFAREIGADGFAPDANRAVALARSLVR